MQSTEAFAPFYVQTRSFQRRILRSALELTEGDVAWAARAMGLEMTSFVEFCEALGGVFPGSVAIEPPPFLTDAVPAPALASPSPLTESVEASSPMSEATVMVSEASEGIPTTATSGAAPAFWSREEVEKFLGLSTQGVLRLHQKGELQTLFDREQGILLFRRDTVEEYAAKRQAQRDAKKTREDELAASSSSSSSSKT